jgi:alpha-1,6-mannosyltransferase
MTVYATGGAVHGLGSAVVSPWFYLGISAAFVCSLWAAHLTERADAAASRRSFALVIVTAALFRLMAIPATPALSDDIYRYLWDGHLQLEGVNPYLDSPSDSRLDAFATSYRGRINNPELPTIYPPATQAVFLVGAALGGSVAAMKLLMVLLDMATLITLGAILRHRGMNPARVAIYGWSPLAVIEVGWSGHCDPVGVCLLAVALLAIIKGSRVVSIAAAALSGAAKYAGWLALPSVLKRSRMRDWLVLPAVVAAVYLPYLSAGWGVFGSLFAYAERWRFNDSLFAVILGVVERSRLSGAVRGALIAAGWMDRAATWESSPALHLTEPLSLAKLISGLLFTAFAVRVVRRGREDPAREVLSLLGAALLLSPTVHPWYLLWVAPFLAVVPRLSWTWLSYAVLVVSYPMMAARSGGDDPLRWLVWVEYAPFFLILAVESARRRLWETG